MVFFLAILLRHLMMNLMIMLIRIESRNRQAHEMFTEEMMSPGVVYVFFVKWTYAIMMASKVKFISQKVRIWRCKIQLSYILSRWRTRLSPWIIRSIITKGLASTNCESKIRAASRILIIMK